MKTKFKSANQSKIRGSVKDPACNYISFPFRAAKRKQINKETKRLGRKKKKGKKKNRTKQNKNKNRTEVSHRKSNALNRRPFNLSQYNLLCKL